jgi:hypothetical protein
MGTTMHNHYVPGKSEKQQELIRKYCAEADSVLSGAADYDSALHLKESLCKRFQNECDSSLVVAATSLHLDSMLKERWGSK